MIEGQIRESEAICAAATPGRYTLVTHPNVPIMREVKGLDGQASTYYALLRVEGPPPFKMICRLEFGYGSPKDLDNARFIEEACKRLPDALAEIRRLQQHARDLVADAKRDVEATVRRCAEMADGYSGIPLGDEIRREFPLEASPAASVSAPESNRRAS